MTRQSARLKNILIALLVGVLAFRAIADVPAQSQLYGIVPGTEVPELEASIGQPSMRIPFKDGWSASVYQLPGHNVIVETAPDDPEHIVSIQIAGYQNPPGKGLLGVNLGDSVSRALEVFGAPLERKASIDAATRKPVPDTFFYRYNTASFEAGGGKITSIKVHFLPRR